jgi:hypothetical protein
MATLHPQMSYYVGDTIMFDVICKDADGNPVNLSGINVDFKLNDPYGNNVENYTIIGAVITGGLLILDMANGKIGVTVPATRTAGYITGYYRDHLRLTVPEPGFDAIVISELVGYIFIKPALKSAVVALTAGSLSVHSPVQ